MSSCCRQQQWTVALDLFEEVGAGGAGGMTAGQPWHR